MTARSRSRTKRAAAARPASKSGGTRFHRREPAEAGGHDRGPRPFLYGPRRGRRIAGPSAGRFNRNDARGADCSFDVATGQALGNRCPVTGGFAASIRGPLEAALGTGVLSRWVRGIIRAPLETIGNALERGGSGGGHCPDAADRGSSAVRASSKATRRATMRGTRKAPRQKDGCADRGRPATSNPRGAQIPHIAKRAGTTHGGSGPLVPFFALGGKRADPNR